MGLADTYRELDNEPFSQCTTCRWYRKLSEDDKTFIDDKAAEHKTNMRKLWRACTSDGELKISESSFRNHIAEHHPRLVDAK